MNVNRESPVFQAFVTGLKNAHAVEQQALQTIEGQLERHEKHPSLIAALRRHHEATKTLAARVEAILTSYGESPSGFKEGVLGFIGSVSSVAHAPTEDEAIKNTFAGFAFKHYEIAMYESLIVMAERAGHADVAPLRENLSEVERLAAELRPLIGEVTGTYLDLELAEHA